MPVSPRSPEHVEAILQRGMEALTKDPGRRLLAIGYFGDPNYADVFENVRRKAPGTVEGFELRRVFQSENIVSVWEIRLRGQVGKDAGG